MSQQSIPFMYLPAGPKMISGDGPKAVFEIDGLYPGYGLTVGNSLRRVLLSSLPGAAVTSVKIKGISHEFSTKEGIMEDVIEIILNLKQVRLKMEGSDSSAVLTLSAKGEKEVGARDIKVPTGVKIMNPDQHIASLTDKKSELEAEITVEKGIGYVPAEQGRKEKLDIGVIAVDAIFTPIRKVSYEVENMRVGDRTDYNRLRISIETDGTVTPQEALNRASNILIDHFAALAGNFEIKEKPDKKETAQAVGEAEAKEEPVKEKTEEIDPAKIKIEDLKISARVSKILLDNGIKTVAGLLRKNEEDVLGLEGMGEKGVKEIKKEIGNYGLTFKK